jgi:hypothetical protein
MFHYSFVCPKIVFQNVVFYRLSRASFTDEYPDSPYRGATIERAALSSAVPVYCGHFHLDLRAFFGVLGYYMRTRASRPTVDGRRPYLHIGVPSLAEQPPRYVTTLPEVLGEDIGSGMVCDGSYMDSGVFDLLLPQRRHLRRHPFLTPVSRF